MTASYSDFLSTRKFSALDGLRALCVLGVIWHHTSGTPGPAVSSEGALGVQFFFAISGFLITTLLLREQRSTGRISLRRFYARRALRILPLYYSVLLLYILLTAATRSHTSEGRAFLAHVPAFATYTSNWFVDLQHGASVTFYFAWSLATEEQFYFLWPPVLVLLLHLTRRTVPAAAATLLLLAAVSEVARLVGDQRLLPERIIGSLSVPILLASLLAVLMNDPRWFPRVAAALGRAWSAPVVFGALTIALLFAAPVDLIAVLMVLAVGTVSIQERSSLHPVLRWRPLAFVGTISYGVYLLHMLAANVVRALLHQTSSPLVFALTVPLVVVVAAVSFRWFESPLLRLKRRFETSPQRAGDEPTRVDLEAVSA